MSAESNVLFLLGWGIRIFLVLSVFYLLIRESSSEKKKKRADAWKPPSKPLSVEEAREIARKVLNPNVPKNFKKAPGLWEIYLRDEPVDVDEPSYYFGVEFPKGMKEAYYYGRPRNKSFRPKDFPLKELAVIDPVSTPQPLINEKDWNLYQQEQVRQYSYLELINEIRLGNPYAAVKMAKETGSTHGIRAKKAQPEKIFWTRIADALARPGWGKINMDPGSKIYREYGDADMKEQISSLSQRLSLSGSAANMSLVGQKLIKKGNKNGLLWLQESARRGAPMSFFALVYYYAGVNKGLPETHDSRLAYALAIKGGELPVDEDMPEDMEDYIDQCLDAADILAADDNELSEEDREYGYAVYEQLELEYEAYQQKMLEDQRAWRKANLPEVNRQLDAWQAEVENNHPGYFERDHQEKQIRSQSK